jgi:hypothetical protein
VSRTVDQGHVPNKKEKYRKEMKEEEKQRMKDQRFLRSLQTVYDFPGKNNHESPLCKFIFVVFRYSSLIQGRRKVQKSRGANINRLFLSDLFYFLFLQIQLPPVPPLPPPRIRDAGTVGAYYAPHITTLPPPPDFHTFRHPCRE